MQNFLKRILCCFIPSRKLRHKIRNGMQRYQIIGSGNKIYIGQTELKSIVPGLNIIISGNNNIIRLPTVPKFENSFIRIDANNVKISISDSNHKMRWLHINAICGDGQHCFIGRNFHCHGVNVQLNEENAALEIGDDCLFSNSISIWPTDGHSILDMKTGDILNMLSGPVTIGNHCWVGEGVRILKNARIPSNTIVGGGCVVGKRFETEYTAIAGNPARVIRENVTWDNLNPMHLIKRRKENKND